MDIQESIFQMIAGADRPGAKHLIEEWLGVSRVTSSQPYAGR